MDEKKKFLFVLILLWTGKQKFPWWETPKPWQACNSRLFFNLFFHAYGCQCFLSLSKLENAWSFLLIQRVNVLFYHSDDEGEKVKVVPLLQKSSSSKVFGNKMQQELQLTFLKSLLFVSPFPSPNGQTLCLAMEKAYISKRHFKKK